MYKGLEVFSDFWIILFYFSTGCSILYVYGIIRHGTRYPTESDNLKQDELTQLRDQIVKNHETDKREYDFQNKSNECTNM